MNRLLNEALGQGATDAVIEVSSHALAQERVFGVPFDVAVFTNLTRDHLDYHRTIEEYFASKRVLFEGCGTEPPRVAVTNIDDEYGVKLADFSRKRSSQVLKYGWQQGDFHAERIDIAPRGTRFDMVTPKEKVAVFSPLFFVFFALKRRAASRWIRSVLVILGLNGIPWGILGVLRLGYPMHFARQTRLDFYHFETVLGGIAIGLLIGLLLSPEFWQIAQRQDTSRHEGLTNRSS